MLFPAPEAPAKAEILPRACSFINERRASIEDSSKVETPKTLKPDFLYIETILSDEALSRSDLVTIIIGSIEFFSAIAISLSSVKRSGAGSFEGITQKIMSRLARGGLMRRFFLSSIFAISAQH